MHFKIVLLVYEIAVIKWNHIFCPPLKKLKGSDIAKTRFHKETLDFRNQRMILHKNFIMAIRSQTIFLKFKNYIVFSELTWKKRYAAASDVTIKLKFDLH